MTTIIKSSGEKELFDTNRLYQSLKRVGADERLIKEVNGVRYLWNPTGDQDMKCSHITIGGAADDRNKAQILVDGEYAFTFERMDYKQVGPHDPCVTKDLTIQQESTACVTLNSIR